MADQALSKNICAKRTMMSIPEKYWKTLQAGRRALCIIFPFEADTHRQFHFIAP